MKIGIVGGGAAGLIAAICAKDKNNEVIILERNKECGKKLLVTGNGRCNYWNHNQDISHYQSNTPHLIKDFIDEDSANEVLSFFSKIGIVPKIKNGHYYPFSNQASTIKDSLLKEIVRKEICVANDFLVSDIKIENNRFIIFSNNEEVIVDKLIIATGSKAAPKTGSDGFGYKFLQNLGHTIVKPLPALVQLIGQEKYFKKWAGVRTDVKVTLYENNQKIKSEEGEIQLTNYGISGICVFNLSNEVARGLAQNKKEDIHIDFLPFINSEKIKWFNAQTKLTDKCVYDLLSSILNIKIVEVIFELTKIAKYKKFNELNEDEQLKIIDYCTNFKINITGTNSFNDAQVCSGGVSLEDVDLKTMESKVINDLYIIGELLDITGECGGYNLGIAWRCGIKVGRAIRGDYD